MASIILSAFADEYADSFEEQLQGLCKLGISHIEIRHVDKKNISKLTKDEVLEAKRLLDKYGIKVSAIGSPLGKIKLDGDLDGHFETAKRVFEYANIIGAKYVRMFSFYAPAGKSIVDMKDEVFSALERMLALAKEYGVILCHENEAKIYGDIPARCRELLDAFPDLMCVFDMGNYVLEGVDPYPEAYRLQKDRIVYFHIKDALSAGAIVPPGCGEAKIAEILAEHKKDANSDFFVSLEPHLELFSGLNSLVGRSFENPYKYPDAKTAFEDAAEKLKELI
ncbi:MAG: sugar phosphate isomerase/epimerase [Clostridia bacterium]|nr:sugar phosphate isomerase/epimerase [Clostridia bacterium]